MAASRASRFPKLALEFKTKPPLLIKTTPQRAIVIPSIVFLFRLSFHRKYDITATNMGCEVTITTELAIDVLSRGQSEAL